MSIWQDSNNNLHDDADGAALNLPNWPQGMTQLSAEQVAAIQAEMEAAQAPIILKCLAQASLDASDKVLVRCMKAGVPYPAAWQSRDIVLRAIVSGSDTTSNALPIQPDYPEGT